AASLAESFGLDPHKVLDESKALPTMGIRNQVAEERKRNNRTKEEGAGWFVLGFMLFIASLVGFVVEAAMTQTFVGGIIGDELHIYRSMSCTAALFLASIICFAAGSILSSLSRR